MNQITSYRALALQVTCQAINQAQSRERAQEIICTAIARIGKQIAASIAFIGRDTKLIVLPEYFLTGFPMGESIADWATKACFEIAGAEYEALGKIAQQNSIYLAGNAYDRQTARRSQHPPVSPSMQVPVIATVASLRLNFSPV